MEIIEVEALTNPTKYPVIRMPGRQFPGVVVQGDSLSILVQVLRNGCDLVRRGEYDEGNETLAEALDAVEAMQRTYEAALADHAIPLPY